MKTDFKSITIHTNPPSVTRSVFNAMKLINEDVSNHIILKELAKAAGTNECTLKKGFKDIFKITVYQHLLKSRMKYALHLLQTTNYKTKDITLLCGYESLSGFITTFRKYFGVSPGELRKYCIETNTNKEIKYQ